MSYQSGSESPRLRGLFESALQNYEMKTKISFAEHPLSKKLQNCHSDESITVVLQNEAEAFSKFRGSDRIMESIRNTVSLLYKVSATAALNDTLDLPFPPVRAIHVGLGVLLATAKGVITSCDALIGLLESMEKFLQSVEIYNKIPPTPAMDEIVVKIMVELLSTLALAAKGLKQGRQSKSVLVDVLLY